MQPFHLLHHPGEPLAEGRQAADPAGVPYPAGYPRLAFKGDARTERAVGAAAASACFQCHTSQESSDFVFSSYRK